MAECSYARCVQQRRNIRRELQRWTRNMVHIVGLEKIAEELMGRRKWKLYQESMSRNYLQPLNNNIKRTNLSEDEEEYQKEVKTQSVVLDTEKEDESTTIKQETNGDCGGDEDGSPAAAAAAASETQETKEEECQKENEKAALERLQDWTPETKCYFCVDGKLDSEHTAHGVLSPRPYESDTSDSHSDSEVPTSLTSTSRGLLNNNHHNLRPGQHQLQLQHLGAQGGAATATATAAAAAAAAAAHAAMTTIENVSMAALAVAALSGAAHAAAHAASNGPPPAAQQSPAAASSPALPPSAGVGVGVAQTPTHLPFYGPAAAAANVLTHNWYLANVARSFQNVTGNGNTGSGAASEVDKGGGGGGISGTGGEQPLDLSKGSATSGNSPATSNAQNQEKISSPLGNNLPRLPTLDTKHIFKAKPRVSAVAGRRTYTEDELQAALRDIQSGKLGTRRAAVIYGIPRSTLRNKVYKLALEKERESHLNSSTLKLDEEEAMDDDKELSGTEEEKEVEKTLEGPLLSVADLLRFSQSASAVVPPGVAGTPDALRHLLAVAADHPDVAPYLLLTSQRLLAAAAAAGTAPADLSTAASGLLLPDFVRRMAAQPAEDARTNNGESEKASLVGRPSPSNSVITKVERPRSESDMETDDSPSNVILKIPSFKPTTASGKNGCDQIFRNMAEATGSIVSPSTTTSEPPSPPLPVSGSGIPGPKPPTMVVPGGAAPAGLAVKDVKDAIAHTISQKFQQSLIAEPARRPAPQQADEVAKRGGYTPPLMGGIPPTSAGGLSVIKEMGRPPPVYHQQHQQQQHQQNQQQQQQKQGSTTGGKGTRPKRGKYRNYDRDSLVEAVRAVQRGEMSVHRAGSYYGVPHSTLEYKVKERHLMRPRKRDPKPNPVDEKIASLKQNDLRVAQEKSKASVQMKPVHKFAPTSPNGIKLPLFEAAAAGGVGGIGHAGYGAPHFPFWPHPGFPHISAPAFPPPPHAAQEFFASQMMQKLQEETNRTTGAHHQQQQQQHPRATSTPPNGSTAGVMSKLSARQMAESLLEGSAGGADGGAGNGSFLDGIIRSSLEQGVPGDKGTATDRDDSDEGPLAPENMSNKALLDQLCRNSRLTPLSKDDGSSGEEGGGRKGSPPLTLSGTPAQTQDSTSSSSAGSSRKNDGGAVGAGSSNSGPSEPMEFSEDLPGGTGRNDGEERRPRIYLKQDLAKMDNLKPETLVRLREDYVPTQHGGEMLDNGCAMTDSAAGSGCGSDDGVGAGSGEHD